MIDWTDPKCQISKHFTVKEAIWFPQWNRLANLSDGLTDSVKQNLINMFQIMDVVREFIGKPINVHVAYRSEAYNSLVRGAKSSAHKALDNCAAVDWDAGEVCEDTRQKLMPMLEQWGLRMEDNGVDSHWIHLDNRPLLPGGHRYFKP